ncbi:hypothetical protein D3Y57_19875 [Sphingomonas paeninsulae]|jgi:hypothetical protein|uniref:Uncharacterized protein n=1 Tax=Sphingomonas paeninsulae TaxID=2319844 RepID=A0A494TEQ7_SPHPE|nr:hypothetical protein [Sphingomonas paeninsulae]AYJ87770.1 hypothetical protein D3Y57_19875 [Sphingomonas paeninsulae]
MNRWFCAALVVALTSSAALAQEKSALKPGFVFPNDHPVRILVFRPDVKVGSQSAGGIVTPMADWTAEARTFLANALVAGKPKGASEIVFMPELSGDDGVLLAEYRALFRGVSDTVLQHRLFKGNRLPTKKTGFEYTLGTGVARLGQIGGGDYGLFITTDDAFGSTGRKMLQLFAAGIAGVGMSSGKHTGYAGLIDLKTGDLLWINADYAMGGNVREADGASKRVAQLLEDFPLQGMPIAAAK